MVVNNGNQTTNQMRANGQVFNGSVGAGQLKPNAVPGRASQKPQGFDWLGAVLRRKSIVAFTVIVSAVLGYLYYLKQPKVFASQLKLMIWTQQPPRLMDSDTVIQPVATGKYLQLISSQTVLEQAAKSGDLGRLSTFAGMGAPEYTLKNMIKVTPVEGAADTLLVTAKGTNPHELPEILTQVVAAFEENLLADSAAFSKESASVFQMLQDKLATDKSSTETRFRELVQKLGISPDPNTHQYVNPYLSEMEELKGIRSDYERELRDISERLKNLHEVEKQPDQLRAESMRVLGIEASKFLQIESRSGRVVNVSDDELELRISKAQSRIDVLEVKVAELRLEESKARRTVGDRHPTAVAASERVNFYATELTVQLELLRRLKAEQGNASKAIDSRKPNDTANPEAIGSENDLVRFYAATLERNSKRLQNSIDALNSDIADIDKKAALVRGDIEELNIMAERIRDTDADLRQTLDKLSTLTLLASNYNAIKVSVIDRPGTGMQVEPKLLNLLALFVFAGVMIGVGTVSLLDWSDLSYRNPEEIKERLGLPVIARIARMSHTGKFKDGHAETLVTVDKPKSPVAEAYRACRTAMLFMANQQNLKCFLVTSAAAGDGKSTTSLNLAMCFAQGGMRTVIVDADLRRPRCHAYLGLQPSPGLKDYSVGDVEAEQIVRPSGLHPNLSVVTAGRHFSNPSEFIDSTQFEQFLAKLREQFDIVIIDSPPVLPVADSLSLASRCDGVLLVMKIRKGVVLSSQKACESLRSVNANLLGVIVNQVERQSHYSDYGKYGYNGYGGYAYYAGRYYGKQNEKYYESEKTGNSEDE